MADLPFLIEDKVEDRPEEVESKGLREEKSLFDSIVAKEERARKHIEDLGLLDEWRLREQYYNTDAWMESKRPEYLTRFQQNDLFECTEAMLPVITNRVPKPEITPKLKTSDLQIEEKEKFLEELNEYAKKVQRELIDVWNDTKMQLKIQEGFREHNIKGDMFIISTYDDDGIENTVADIRNIKPDPSAKSLEDCEKTWLVYTPILPVSEIRRIYGVNVKPEGDYDKEGHFVLFDRDQIKNLDEKYGLARLFIIFLNDFSEEYDEDYKKDENGDIVYDSNQKPEKVQVKKLKYAKGKRMVTIAPSHTGWIIDDRANPYGRIPVFRASNYKRSGNFWGLSEGKNIQPHTDARNMLVSNIIDNGRLTGNPQKEVIKSQLIDEGQENEQTVDNEPGGTYDVNMPDTIRNINPPSMPAYIPLVIENLDKDKDKITGVTDAYRAESKSGDSGVKVRSLIAQATGRLQPKVLNFVDFAREIYKHWVYIIQNFYPEDMVQKDEDSTGQANYVVFKPKQFGNIELDVKVSQMSMLPFDNETEFQEAQILFKANAISTEHLIDCAPNIRDKQRAKEDVAQMQEAAMQQQQLEQAIDQFAQLASQAAQIHEETGEFSEEIIEPMINIVQQFPQLIQTNQFMALPDEMRKVIAAGAVSD